VLRSSTTLTCLIRLQDLERSFLRHLRAEGRSPATLRLYGRPYGSSHAGSKATAAQPYSVS
jgi:hypothetical protein